MDNLINFSQLAKSIASMAGCTADDAETFLREAFALAGERLAEEGEVTMPGIGRFALTEGHLVYAPDPDLAAAVNAPFAAFEAMELPEGFDTDESEPAEEEMPAEEPEPVEEPEPAEEEPAETPEQEQIAAAAEMEQAEDSDPDPQPEPAAEPEPEPEPEEPRKRRSLWWLWLVACVVFFVVGFLCGRMMPGAGFGWPSSTPDTVYLSLPDTLVAVVTPVDTATETEADTDTLVPEELPEAKPRQVLDTVSATRFLTTMARRHYGQMEYWVYIYEENAAKLRNPERIDAGTVLVIPPAEKYGLKAGDPAKIAEASRKAAEIYARFN